MGVTTNSEPDRFGIAIADHLGLSHEAILHGSVRAEIDGDVARVRWDGAANIPADVVFRIWAELGPPYSVPIGVQPTKPPHWRDSDT